MTDSRKVLSLEVGKLTDLGKIRQHLVDSLGFYKPDDPDLFYSKGELFLVADGIGGHAFGAQAARLATELIIKSYYDKSAETDIETSLKHAFNLTNMRIIENNKKNSGHIQAGTSVTCVVIQRGTLHVAHIGNSRLYLIKGNKIKQLTHDHVSRGEATVPSELRKTNPKFEVSKALGWQPGVEIDYFSQSLKPNDCLLICTDGLFQVLDNQEIGRLALKYDPQDACEKFIASANEKGGPDNITTILIKINGLITISESFAQNLESGINLINPATQQPVQPEEHQPGATFRIGGVPPESEPEESETGEITTPKPGPAPAPKPVPEPTIADKPADVPPPAPEKETAPPRIPTPRPFQAEREPEIEFTPTQHAASGMRRRRNVAKPKKQLDYQKIFKGTFFALIIITLLFAVGYLLNSEGGLSSDEAVTETESSELFPVTSDSSLIDSNAAPVSQTDLEAQAGAANRSATVSTPMKVVVLNGNGLSGSAIQRLVNSLKSSDLGQTIIENDDIPKSPGSRTKIIYRFPASGNAEGVRSIAKKIQETVKEKYKKEIEIVRCDITLILGKDFQMGELKTSQLKRKILDTPQTASIHLEILNGSGTSGLGGRINAALKDLLIDETNYLKIIDVRNATNFKFANTILKCRPSKITVASKLAGILGLSAISRSIVIDDLEDIQLLLGRDFNY